MTEQVITRKENILVSNQTDEIYIGSTCRRLLRMRTVGHRSNFNLRIRGEFNYVSRFEK